MVMAIIVILAAIAIPALSGLTRVSSEGAARTALNSLFASARSLASRSQSYVGVRFQQTKEGRTYAVLLVPAPDSEEFPNGCPGYSPDCMFLTFVAAGGSEPVLMPRGVELAGAEQIALYANPDDPTLWNADNATKTDCRSYVRATTFTVVFSPAGQIVRKQVHVAQRRDQWKQDKSGNWHKAWQDPVFNFAGGGKFSPDVQDKPPDIAPARDTDPDPQEQADGSDKGRTGSDTAKYQDSQSSIWVYERDKRLEHTGFDVATCHPFTQYIQTSGSLIQLNVYTGAPVNTQQ